MQGQEVARRTRVKICGTTRLEDARYAAELGVDALGFIFYPPSPRFIQAEKARAIINQLPPFVDPVGVFVDASIDEIIATAQIGLVYLQLHGRESAEFCRRLRRELPFCRLIKAFRVGADSRAGDFSPYRDCVDAYLLDTYVKGEKGGTGAVFDWTLMNSLNLERPVILAGGLSPANITQAVAAVCPYGVDVNSGVEVRPGVKDHSLVKKLFARLS